MSVLILKCLTAYQPRTEVMPMARRITIRARRRLASTMEMMKEVSIRMMVWESGGLDQDLKHLAPNANYLYFFLARRGAFFVVDGHARLVFRALHRRRRFDMGDIGRAS